MGRGPRGAPMVGGVRMLEEGRPGGVVPLPLESGMPRSGLPGEAGMPMYLRARSSIPACTFTVTFAHHPSVTDCSTVQIYAPTSTHAIFALKHLMWCACKSHQVVQIMELHG